MRKIDKTKRTVNTAVKRSEPSKAALMLVEQKRMSGRVLDYGCGFGFDADHFGWEAYDPYYRPRLPEGSFDTIICNLVLNVLARNTRRSTIARLQSLLAEEGSAYLVVPRNVPRTGKLGIHHSLQNYVVLTLDSLYADSSLEIYVLGRHSEYKDKTIDFAGRRDKR